MAMAQRKPQFALRWASLKKLKLIVGISMLADQLPIHNFIYLTNKGSPYQLVFPVNYISAGSGAHAAIGEDRDGLRGGSFENPFSRNPGPGQIGQGVRPGS